MRSLHTALVHYPILDAQGGIVTTAITNLDIHDIARSSRSYGCESYFLIHPVAAQRELVERIQGHWREGASGKRIPDRKTALEIVRCVPTLEDLFAAFGGREHVELWATSARREGIAVTTYREARALLTGEGKPVCLLFGTGWGMPRSILDGCDRLIEPIASAASSYNHLSVRAAAAISLDRLRGAD
jgi:hypothetical protein